MLSDSEGVYIHDSAEVSELGIIGVGAKVWQLAHIRENSVIGKNTIIGRGVYIGPGVQIGDNCKIQNYSLVYEPSQIENGVFIGPGVVLTNDLYPRAVNPDGSQKSASDWLAVGVIIREGASIGARAVCVAPVEIGAWSMIAAGSTVVNDVPAFALVAGTPARRINWVGKAGYTLTQIDDCNFECPKTGERYHQSSKEKLELI